MKVEEGHGIPTEDDDDNPFLSRTTEAAAIVNLLVYALRWVETLEQDKESNLTVLLRGALREALEWRNSLTN